MGRSSRRAACAHALTDDIPNKEGFAVTVSSGSCRDGRYRAVVHVSGVGPSTSGASGTPFNYHEAGPEVHITAEDCAGGG